MRRVLVYCNLFWLLFSLPTCIESYRLKPGTINTPGAGFFPLSAGLIMFILSLAALFRSIRDKNTVMGKSRQEPLRWWNIVMILAVITAYAFSLEKMGFRYRNWLRPF